MYLSWLRPHPFLFFCSVSLMFPKKNGIFVAPCVPCCDMTSQARAYNIQQALASDQLPLIVAGSRVPCLVLM